MITTNTIYSNLRRFMVIHQIDTVNSMSIFFVQNSIHFNHFSEIVVGALILYFLSSVLLQKSWKASPSIWFHGREPLIKYQLRITQYDKDINLEKLFRKNKTSSLLKTPEKDFHLGQDFSRNRKNRSFWIWIFGYVSLNGKNKKFLL